MNERSFVLKFRHSIAGLKSDGGENPRHAFQVRFFLGACLLALLVSALSVPIAIVTEPFSTVVAIVAFAVLILVQVGLLWMGCSIRVLVWTLLGTVTLFLIAVSVTPKILDPAQLPWLILIPLAARAFTAPRIEDADPQPTFRATVIGSCVAVAALFVIVAFHQLELNFGREPSSNPPWAMAANFALFLVSALGLVVLYDLTAQATIAELQRVRQMLAICAWCREINSDGEWMSLEDYTTLHTNSELSHGICPKCAEAEFQRLKAKFG